MFSLSLFSLQSINSKIFPFIYLAFPNAPFSYFFFLSPPRACECACVFSPSYPSSARFVFLTDDFSRLFFFMAVYCCRVCFCGCVLPSFC